MLGLLMQSRTRQEGKAKGWLGVENGGRADLWIAGQAAYDLWQVRKAGAPKVQRAQLITT